MAKRDNPILLLLQQVSIPELLAIVIGVPAMLSVVQGIWQNLTSKQQWGVAVALTFVLVSIVLFLYGRLRRELLIVPYLLNKKHKLAESIARGITPSWDWKSLAAMLQLTGVDATALEAAIETVVRQETTLEDSGVIEQAVLQAEEKGREEHDLTLVIGEYLAEQSGLTKALGKDANYTRLEARVNAWRDKFRCLDIRAQ